MFSRAMISTLLLTASVAAQAASIEIRGNLGTTRKDSAAYVYAEYEYRGSNPVCKSLHFTEDGFKHISPVSQRLIELGSGELNLNLSTTVKQKVFCELELNQNAIKVVVGKKQMFANAVKMGKQIDKKTAEFRGAAAGTLVKQSSSSQNKYTCAFSSESRLAAECAVNSIGMDSSGRIDLDIELK